MEVLKEYAFSIISCAMICGIISLFPQESKGVKLIRFLCGIYLTSIILCPVTALEIGSIFDFTDTFCEEAAVAVQQGCDLAHDARTEIITEQFEAYILEEAAKLGIQIAAEVTLNENLTPSFVRIEGSVFPEAKNQLAHYLETALGITEENQLWTG